MENLNPSYPKTLAEVLELSTPLFWGHNSLIKVFYPVDYYYRQLTKLFNHIETTEDIHKGI